ncbi:MAG: hypothetical protein EOO61_10680 [Hymenobacter sp.]|nr:MAG: hypothetical protein EOO61_10680 [Hymenobacter sp.]
MRTFVACIILQLFTWLAAAQVVRQPLNPLLSSGAYSQHHTDAFSFTTNQAALATTTAFTTGIYGERRFMLDGLGWYQGAVVLPTKSGNFGLKGTRFGKENNIETELGLAYGRKLNDNIAIGAAFNYYTQEIPLYGSWNAMTIEGGILMKINEQVKAGIHIYNPNGSTLGKNGETLPAIFTIGAGYEASEQVIITAEVQKVENEKINCRAGLSYYFDKKLYAKAGLSSANSLWAFGAGVKLEAFSLEVQTSYHQQLGLTPGIALIFHKTRQ